MSCHVIGFERGKKISLFGIFFSHNQICWKTNKIDLVFSLANTGLTSLGSYEKSSVRPWIFIKHLLNLRTYEQILIIFIQLTMPYIMLNSVLNVLRTKKLILLYSFLQNAKIRMSIENWLECGGCKWMVQANNNNKVISAESILILNSFLFLYDSIVYQKKK